MTPFTSPGWHTYKVVVEHEKPIPTIRYITYLAHEAIKIDQKTVYSSSSYGVRGYIAQCCCRMLSPMHARNAPLCSQDSPRLACIRRPAAKAVFWLLNGSKAK